MTSDVFISYSSKDANVAEAACKAMEAAGLHCWIAPRDIFAGEDWPGAILRGIHTSRVMVLIFSASANTSNQIKREVERAVNRGVPVIPFRIEDLQPSPNLEFFISTPHWLDAYMPPIEEHFTALAQAVQRLLERLPEEAPPGIERGVPAKRGDGYRRDGYGPGRRQERERPGRGVLMAAMLVLIASVFGFAGCWFGIEKPKQEAEHRKLEAAEADQQRERILAEAEKAKAEAEAERAEVELEKAKLAAASAAPEPTAAPPAGAGGWFLFPDVRNRYLRRSELGGLTTDQLWRWRNEIYARYGLIFSSARGRALARSLGESYVPRDPDQDRVYSAMTPADKANVDLINALENGQ